MAPVITCDGCREDIEGPRVRITTEATGAHGVDVEVTKSWVLCRDCGEKLFDRVGEASPWVDEDFKTVVLPDDELTSYQMGGYSSSRS